jgi:acid phosphatase
VPAATGTGTVIGPTLNLFKDAIANGVSVFFITGRPSAVQTPTETNLRAAGYDNWAGLIFKPTGIDTEPYKAGERKKLEDQGYDILLNMGDQESDLDGGHADRSFKLPNPFYFISD